MKHRLLILLTLLCATLGGAAELQAQQGDSLSRRFHVYAGLGFSSSRGTSNSIAYMQGINFTVDNYSGDWLSSSKSYRQGSGTSLFVEYSVSPKVSIGVAASTLGKFIGSQPFVYGSRYEMPYYYSGRVALRIDHATAGYYLVGSYLFLQHQGLYGIDVRCGLGFGMNSCEIHYGSAAGYYYESGGEYALPVQQTFKSQPAGGLLYINLDFWSGASLSACFNVSYRYIPVQSIDPVKLESGPYTDYSTTPPQVKRIVLALPGQEISLCNFLYGLMIGVHL